MKYIWIVMICVGLCACHRQSEYQKRLETELASNKRYDSLFLNLYFGMGKKDFFTSCWKMNKQGLLIQGPNNLSVEYEITDGLKYPAFMRFYPKFNEDRIYYMPVEFSYKAYAPWNKSLAVDSLLTDVRSLMETWYGKGFLFVENEEGNKKVWVKLDGNRRIRIFKKDISTVGMDLTDMPIYLQLNDSTAL